jgi:hypothetical protein
MPKRSFAGTGYQSSSFGSTWQEVSGKLGLPLSVVLSRWVIVTGDVVDCQVRHSFRLIHFLCSVSW